MTLNGDGFLRLMATLEQAGSDGATLTANTVRQSLEGARRLGLPWEEAWAATINRVQPSSLGGVIDPLLDAELREDRALLEEQRPLLQAAYEHRRPSLSERGRVLAAADARLDPPRSLKRAA